LSGVTGVFHSYESSTVRNHYGSQVYGPAMDLESELSMACRHVSVGEACIERQKATLARLRLAGHSTAAAEQMLSNFKQAQVLHLWSVRQVMDELRNRRERPSRTARCESPPSN